MNKKAKGFTLIELLTVIATPIILGVLDKARRNTYKNQLLLYVEALKQQSALVLMGPGYSKLQEVDSNFYTPTNSTAGSIVRVSYITRQTTSDWIYSGSINRTWTTGAFAINAQNTGLVRNIKADGNIDYELGSSCMKVRPVIVLQK